MRRRADRRHGLRAATSSWCCSRSTTLRPLALPVTIALHLSHAGIVRGACSRQPGCRAEEQAAAYDRLLDGDLTVVDEVEARLPQLNAPLRMLFEVDGQRAAVTSRTCASRWPARSRRLAEPLDELEFVVDALEARGVRPAIEAVLARSFEYYSGVVMRDRRRTASVSSRRALRRADRSWSAAERCPRRGSRCTCTPTAAALQADARDREVRRVVVQATADDASTIGRGVRAAAASARERDSCVETIEGMHSQPTTV